MRGLHVWSQVYRGLRGHQSQLRRAPGRHAHPDSPQEGPGSVAGMFKVPNKTKKEEKTHRSSSSSL